MANPADKILDHKWLDPACIELGCQSLVLNGECRTRQEAQVDLANLLAAAKRENESLKARIAELENNVTIPPM